MVSKGIIIVTVISLMFIFSGCVEKEWIIKPVIIQSTTWDSPSDLDVIFYNPNDFSIDGNLMSDWDIRKIPASIPPGETLRRFYGIYTGGIITTKRQGNILINANYLHKNYGREYQIIKERELTRKVIDLPYVNLKLQPSSNNVILNDLTNQYLTLENNGNTIVNYQTQTVLSEHQEIHAYDTGVGIGTIGPGEVKTFSLYSGCSGSCIFVESGTTTFEVRVYTGKVVKQNGYSVSEQIVVASSRVSWIN